MSKDLLEAVDFIFQGRVELERFHVHVARFDGEGFAKVGIAVQAVACFGFFFFGSWHGYCSVVRQTAALLKCSSACPLFSTSRMLSAASASRSCRFRCRNVIAPAYTGAS